MSAGQLDEAFKRSEIVGWFRRQHSEVKLARLRPRTPA
jgi:hypothetical protein